jgi:hypothetical protein
MHEHMFDRQDWTPNKPLSIPVPVTRYSILEAEREKSS